MVITSINDKYLMFHVAGNVNVHNLKDYITAYRNESMQDTSGMTCLVFYSINRNLVINKINELVQEGLVRGFSLCNHIDTSASSLVEVHELLDSIGLTEEDFILKHGESFTFMKEIREELAVFSKIPASVKYRDNSIKLIPFVYLPFKYFQYKNLYFTEDLLCTSSSLENLKALIKLRNV